jgi:hypothetical protein
VSSGPSVPSKHDATPVAGTPPVQAAGKMAAVPAVAAATVTAAPAAAAVAAAPTVAAVPAVVAAPQAVPGVVAEQLGSSRVRVSAGAQRSGERGSARGPATARPAIHL